MKISERIFRRDVRAASRLLSWIDDGDPRALAELQEIYPRTGRSYIIGITGPPGSGKSTLADRLISHYRSSGERVGVLAIDPTSPVTGGAILGDRIRMQDHATDSEVFIRSMASRNWPGGLSRSASEAARVLDAFGCGVVIVETVGTGQSDIDISRLAYTTVLVCTPAAGDKIQALKAGIIELADIVVLNKVDMPEAAGAARALEMILGMARRRGWQVPMIRTAARDGTGVKEVAQAIERHRRMIEESGALLRRKMDNARIHLREIIRDRLCEDACRNLPDDRQMEKLIEKIFSRSADPYSVADQFVGNIKKARKRP